LQTKRIIAFSVIWIVAGILFLYIWMRTATINWFVVGTLFAVAMARIAWTYRKQNALPKADPPN
jgi:hypothetical protein